MEVTMKRHAAIQSVRRRRGFTLTEVLLVLAILGVIAAMVIPNLIGRQRDAYIRNTRVSIAALESNAKQYAFDHDGEMPTSINALLNPGQDSSGRAIAPYVEKIPKDAWNSPLNYEYPSGKTQDKPAIWSSGPDKANNEGSGDDINNWSQQ
jgi:general secretion pathway protein G